MIFIMSLFFVNCERTVLFSVKRDLDPPFTTLRLVPIAYLSIRLQPWILARNGRGYTISVLFRLLLRGVQIGIRGLYPLNCKLQQLRLCCNSPFSLMSCYNSPFSLMSAVYGTTSVYPSRGFDPGAVLTAIQQERLEFPSLFQRTLYRKCLEKIPTFILKKTWKGVVEIFQ